jgi:hypothetical protein
MSIISFTNLQKARNILLSWKEEDGSVVQEEWSIDCLLSEDTDRAFCKQLATAKTGTVFQFPNPDNKAWVPFKAEVLSTHSEWLLNELEGNNRSHEYVHQMGMLGGQQAYDDAYGVSFGDYDGNCHYCGGNGWNCC